MTSVSIKIDPANQEARMKRKILLGLVAGAVALVVGTLFVFEGVFRGKGSVPLSVSSLGAW